MSASNDKIEKLIDSLPLNLFKAKKEEINQLDCPKCPISFIKRDDWRNHIRFRHRLCEKCLVHNIDDKTVHSYCKRCRSNIHNVIRPVSYGRGHECARCCIWFTSRIALEYHIIKECRYIEDDDDDATVSNADSSSRKRKVIPLPQDPPKRKVLIRTPIDQNKSRANSSSIKTSNKRNSRKVIQIHVCGLCGAKLTSEARIEDHKTLCPIRNQIKEEPIVKSESIEEDAQSTDMNHFINKGVEIKCNEETTSSLSNADSSPSTRSVIPLMQDLPEQNVDIRSPSIDQNKKKVVTNSIIKPVKVSDKCDSLVKSTPNSNHDTPKRTTHIPNPSSSSARFRRHQCPGCYSWFSMKHVFEYHIIKECRYIKDDDDDDTSVSNADSSSRKRRVIPLPQDLPKQKVTIRTPLDQNKSKVNSNSIKTSNKRNPSVKPEKVIQIHVCGLCGVNLTSEASIEEHKIVCPMRIQIKEEPIVKSESIEEDAQSMDMNNFINNEIEIKCNEESASSLSNADSSPRTRRVIPLPQEVPKQNAEIRSPSIDQNKMKVVTNSIIKPVKVSDKCDSLVKSTPNSNYDTPKHCKRCRTTHISSPSSCPANFRRHQCPGCYSWFDMEHVFEYHIRKVCPHVTEENLTTYEFNAKRTAIQLPPDNNQKLNNLVVKLRKVRDTYKCGFCGENFTFESSVEEHKRMCPMRIQIKEEPIEESDSTQEDVIDNFIKEEVEIKEEPQDEGYEIGSGTLLDTTTVKTEPIDYEISNVEIKIEQE